MELTFEIIREAGVRMPRAIGPAISIVGALVLGQAAVQAGLVSAAMVIVVSFTAISNFVIPAINMAAAIRLLRFVFMILGGTLGLFGILAGAIPVLVHMIALRSFGIPYMTPLAPFDGSAVRDFFVRAPWNRMNRRPNTTANRNPKRQSEESSGMEDKKPN
ncbi:Spore germination protein A1 [compost metagenome]